jgi:hypothetical protein
MLNQYQSTMDARDWIGASFCRRGKPLSKCLGGRSAAEYGARTSTYSGDTLPEAPCLAPLPQRLLVDGPDLAYCSCTFIRTGSLLPTPGR